MCLRQTSLAQYRTANQDIPVLRIKKAYIRKQQGPIFSSTKMKSILKKFGIVQARTLRFDITSEEFIRILKENVVSGSHKEAIFQKWTHTYKGTVESNSFRLKEVHKLFDNTRNDARIRGQVTDVDHGIEIELETMGMAGRNIAFLLAGIFFLIVLPLSLDEDIDLYVRYFISYFIPVFFVIGSFVWAKNAAGKMLIQFERESFFLIEKNRKR